MESAVPWRVAVALVGMPLAIGLGVYFATLDDGRLRREWSGPRVDWTADGYAPAGAAVLEHSGEEHCNWQDTRFLRVAYPVLRASGFQPGRSDQFPWYVGDPFERHGALAEENPGLVSALPPDAIKTPYHHGRRTLWLASDFERAVYIEEKDRIERWVRMSGGCD